MRNLHNIISDQYGMEALCLLREWEKVQIRRTVTTGTIEYSLSDVIVRELHQLVSD